jgi:putative FmdB family regulatory protein
MPLYDWKCDECMGVFEAVAPMSCTEIEGQCPNCVHGNKTIGCGAKKFTPTKNFLIPESFRRTSTWHMPNGERSTESAPISANNSIHAPKRTSFKEAFDKQWR